MNRLEKLKELESDLKNLMAKANSRCYAPLAKQYRETIKEIEELEGNGAPDDEISDILQKRSADGKSRTVRKDKSKV